MIGFAERGRPRSPPEARPPGLQGFEEEGRSRLGFLEGEITVPDDFDHLGAEEIEALFKKN